MMRFGAVALVVVSLATLSNASAGNEAAQLKDTEIAAFIAVWPGTAKALAAVDPEFDPALTNALSSQLEEMAAGDSKDSKLDAAVLPARFGDFETFAALTSLILTAAPWAKDAPDNADLAAAISAVEADTVRIADEKVELIAALKKAYETALARKPPDADIAVVMPFVSAIEKAIAVDE